MTLTRQVEVNERTREAIDKYKKVMQEAQDLMQAAMDALAEVVQQEYGVNLKEGEAHLNVQFYDDCGAAFLCPAEPQLHPMEHIFKEARKGMH